MPRALLYPALWWPGPSNWQMQMIEQPFNMFLRTEIAGGQFPVEKDFKRLVELGEVGTAG
jgi:hypothetical protein